MRILMTTDTVGGVWTYALELAYALRKRGVDVVVAALGPGLSRSQRREAAETGADVVARPTALEWMDEPWSDVAATGDWLLELAPSARPDVVHLNEYAYAALPFDAPVVVVGHSCVLSWHEAVRGESSPPKSDRYRAVVRRGLAAADLLVAPTRWMLSELERLYRPRCERLVIPNGRDPALFAPARKEPFVLAAGRAWDEAKNVAALDRVAPRLSWPVCAAGDAGEWKPRSIRLLGRLEPRQLRSVMARASVYALPARYEPFGLSALEAALSGCALLLGDIPSLREVWDDAALFVEAEDDDAIADGLGRLVADESLRRRLAQRGRERAADYTAERAADAYAAAYARLLAPVAAETG